MTEGALNGLSSEILDDMLQRHFVELTDRFMQPLNRFFDTLVVGSPLQMCVSCFSQKSLFPS